jgi:hypothetical protein
MAGSRSSSRAATAGSASPTAIDAANERSKALDELVQLTEALGLYDDEVPEAR